VQSDSEGRGGVCLRQVPYGFAVVGEGGEEGHVDDFVGLAIGVLEFDEAEGRLHAFAWTSTGEKRREKLEGRRSGADEVKRGGGAHPPQQLDSAPYASS
jgi:hypothetical protein